MRSFSDNATRPWTGQSHATSATRPRTGQPTQVPTTAATSRYEASFVIALLEGRGVAREVGIAALDRDTGRVMLVQVVFPVAVRCGTLGLTVGRSLLTVRHM
jgi:DNA mismatch repair protein MSH4